MSGSLVVLVIGAVLVGGYLDGISGALIGGILGFLVAAIIDMRKRIDALENGVRRSAGGRPAADVECREYAAVVPEIDEPLQGDVHCEDVLMEEPLPAVGAQPAAEKKIVTAWQSDSNCAARRNV
ncbi:MAG: hypothetical protein FJ119_09965 [Deltaproteobacteria bacterium]|nr:hypothetical protein [Deltaproteobacteria bacterium]